MLVYDKDLTAFYYWDGPNLQWVQVGSGNGDNWGTNVVQTSGANISGDGTLGNPLIITDGDSDPTNEIELPTGGTTGQILSTDGSGTYTWVSDNSGTDIQNIANLAFNNTTNILTVGIQNGTSQTVDLTSLLTEVDGSTTNEIQDLAINTTTNILTITNNGTPTSIDLTLYLDNTDSQNLTSTATGGNATVNISNGTSTTFSINDADFDPTNEIELPTGGTTGQVLSTDGSGTYTWVTDGTGTDIQNIANLAFNNTTNILTVGIQNGTSQTVDLTSLLTEVDGSTTNEIQDLAINTTTNILTITNNGTPTSIDLTPYLDNTDAQNITGSSFNAITGDLVIGIQNGTSQTLNFNGLKDHDWYKVGTTTAPTTINDNIFTQGNVGIGITIPTAKLDVTGNGRFTSGVYLDGASVNSGNSSLILRNNSGNEDYAISVGNPNNSETGFTISKLTGYTIGNSIQFSSTNLLRILTNGNVGINTSTPTSKLDINGDLRVRTIGIGTNTDEVLVVSTTGVVKKIAALVPPGAVIAFNLATCPTGWATADGTFGTPDLRGEFVRGLDNGRGVDPSRALMSWQKGSLIVNNEYYSDNELYAISTNAGGNPYNGLGNLAVGKDPINLADYPFSDVRMTYTSSGASSNNNLSSYLNSIGSSRPRNVALLYCIKQ